MNTQGCDYPGQRDRRANRQIDATTNDDHSHPNCTDGNDDRLRKHNAEIVWREEPARRLHQDRKDHDDEHEPENRPKTIEPTVKYRRSYECSILFYFSDHKWMKSVPLRGS